MVVARFIKDPLAIHSKAEMTNAVMSLLDQVAKLSEENSQLTEQNSQFSQQFPITFKLSGPAPNLGVRHGSVVAGARWGHSNTIQAAAWLVKLR